MPYDINKMREKLKKRVEGRKSDPNEFKPPKADREAIKLRFYVLPPVMAGDTVYGGTKAERDMDLFYVQTGAHWVDKRPYTCPRIVTQGEEDQQDCAMCQAGFDLLAELKKQRLPEDEAKAHSQAIRKQWLAGSQYMVNIFFPAHKNNPEELHNRVMWFKAPKTVWDTWTQCLDRDKPDAVDSEDEDDEQEAYGVFFDENAAFMYELKITKGKTGQFNEYVGSKFVNVKSGPKPIAADAKSIKKILDSRHDLYSKIEAWDPDVMKRLTAKLIDGDDDDDDTSSGGGFDKSESRKPATRSAIVEADDDDDEDEEEKKPAKADKKPPKADKKPDKKPKAPEPEDDEDDALAGEKVVSDDEDDDPPPRTSSKSNDNDDEDDDDLDDLIGTLDDD